MRVALFVPCFVNLLSPEVGLRTARLLERLGHEVVAPAGQTCCGQPALNSGRLSEARLVASRQLDVLARAEAEAVVAPSGSCVAAITRLARHHLGLDHPLMARTYELSSFLVDVLGVEDVGARFDGKVAWHDGCHALRLLGVREAPRRLLDRVRGLELVELDPAEECCGFGGTFSVKLPEVSVGMGTRKALAIEATGADVVASAEPSCLLQIEGVLKRRGSRVRAVHLVDLLEGSR